MDINSEDQSIVDTRANLTELINSVKLLRRTYFLTSRGKRQVAIVTLEVGELVQRIGGPDRAAEILAAHLAEGVDA